MRLLSLLAFFLAAASHVPSALAADAFRFRLIADPVSLDWSFRRLSFETIILMNTMEGLVEVDADFKPVPALAAKWEVSTDKLTYTFHLKPGVRWSDGVPLRAADFVSSWRRVITPATRSEYQAYFNDIEGAEDYSKGKLRDFSRVGLKALDDLSLQIKLRRPSPYFLQSLHLFVAFPQRSDVIEKHGARWWEPTRTPTLGPYRVTKWEKGRLVEFERNSAYHGEPARVGRVVGVIEPDAAKARELVEKNEIDLLFAVTTSDIVKFTAAGWQARQFDALNTAYLAFVPKAAPASNIDLRKGIAQALDRSKIPMLLENGFVPTESMIPKGLYGYEPVALALSPDGAHRAMLQGGYREPSDFPTLKLVYINSIHEKIAAYVRDTLKATIGLNITLTGVTPGEFPKVVSKSKHHMYIETWWADYPDPDNFMRLFTSRSQVNRPGWVNPQYDSLVAEAAKSPDALTRIQKYTAAQKILIQEHAIVIPLYSSKITALLSPSVSRFEINPLLGHLYFKNVTLK